MKLFTNGPLGNPHKTDYSYLLRDLLIKPDICPGRDKLPKSKKEWQTFIDMSYRNRLVTLLYHFVDCRICSPSVPKMIKGMIQQYYTEALIRYENYKKIRRKLKVFIKKTGIPLILIKDLDEETIKKYYPPYYVPLKFDIDVFGKYKDKEIFLKYIKKVGYEPIKYHSNSTSLLDSQIKLHSGKEHTVRPQIEYRFLTVTIPHFEKPLVDGIFIKKLTDDIWRSSRISISNFSELPQEYSVMFYCLNFYFGDTCKSLNSLYRLHIVLKQKNQFYWKELNQLANQYHISNVIYFILDLVNEIFPSSFKVDSYPDISIKLAKKIIDLDFICRRPISFKISNSILEMDDYLFFLTRGILSEESIWAKIIFFMHPKRLFFLLSNLRS